jgi:hypothetical protein
MNSTVYAACNVSFISCLFLLLSVQCLVVRCAKLTQYALCPENILSPLVQSLLVMQNRLKCRRATQTAARHTCLSHCLIFLLDLFSPLSLAVCDGAAGCHGYQPGRNSFAVGGCRLRRCLLARGRQKLERRPSACYLAPSSSVWAVWLGRTVQCLCVPVNMWRTASCAGHESSSLELQVTISQQIISTISCFLFLWSCYTFGRTRPMGDRSIAICLPRQKMWTDVRASDIRVLTGPCSAIGNS